MFCIHRLQRTKESYTTTVACIWQSLQVMVQVHTEGLELQSNKMPAAYKVVTNFDSMFSDLPQHPSHSYVQVRGKNLFVSYSCIDYFGNQLLPINQFLQLHCFVYSTILRKLFSLFHAFFQVLL